MSKCHIVGNLMSRLIYAVCMRVAKALVNMCTCTDTPEHRSSPMRQVWKSRALGHMYMYACLFALCDNEKYLNRCLFRKSCVRDVLSLKSNFLSRYFMDLKRPSFV